MVGKAAIWNCATVHFIFVSCIFQPIGEILVDSTRLARSTTIYNVRWSIYSKIYIYSKLIDLVDEFLNFIGNNKI